jgi:hypothetical protein
MMCQRPRSKPASFTDKSRNLIPGCQAGSSPVPRQNSLRLLNQQDRPLLFTSHSRYQRPMLPLIRVLFASIRRVFRTRRSLVLENLVLRQQLTVLVRKHSRPQLVTSDRLFWVLVSRFWSGWKQALIIVKPETVVRWHRAGFALYWRAISRARSALGRKRISKEIRDQIFRMVTENPTWGAPRIHGELLMLGFDVSERTISRWMRRAPRHPEPAKRWLTFLRNHREAIAAMDFFTVPTVTFGLLYCFFIIGHDLSLAKILSASKIIGSFLCRNAKGLELDPTSVIR